MTELKARRGRRRKRWVIVVTAIPPERYPEYREDPDHSFVSMESTQRIEEIDQVCAKLWLRKDDTVESPAKVKETLASAA